MLQVAVRGPHGGSSRYRNQQQWQVVKTYGSLSEGEHIIQIKILGTKDAKSKGKTVVVDAFSGPIAATGTSVPVSPSMEDEESSPTADDESS